VTLVVAVSPELKVNEAENAVANFDLEIDLADVGTPTTSNGCPVDPTVIAGFASAPVGTGTIAYTGAGLVYPTLAVAASALALGSVFAAVARRRRRRADEEARS
jgi:hypothetical protein